MTQRILAGLLLACCSALTACEAQKPAAPPVTTVARPVDPPAAPAPAPSPFSWKILEKLGAKIEVPTGCALDDTSAEGRPPVSYSLYDQTGAFSLTVRGTTERDPPTLEAMKQSLRSQKFTREEALADGGWALEWEAAGGPLFGVAFLRKVGGLEVRCARTLDKKADADAVSRACQSLAAK